MPQPPRPPFVSEQDAERALSALKREIGAAKTRSEAHQARFLEQMEARSFAPAREGPNDDL